MSNNNARLKVKKGSKNFEKQNGSAFVHIRDKTFVNYGTREPVAISWGITVEQDVEQKSDF